MSDNLLDDLFGDVANISLPGHKPAASKPPVQVRSEPKVPSALPQDESCAPDQSTDPVLAGLFGDGPMFRSVDAMHSTVRKSDTPRTGEVYDRAVLYGKTHHTRGVVQGQPWAILQSPDDLMIWPDDSWCFRSELSVRDGRSDDFHIVYITAGNYNEVLHELGGE